MITHQSPPFPGVALEGGDLLEGSWDSPIEPLGRLYSDGVGTRVGFGTAANDLLGPLLPILGDAFISGLDNEFDTAYNLVDEALDVAFDGILVGAPAQLKTALRQLVALGRTHDMNLASEDDLPSHDEDKGPKIEEIVD